ncbi:dehydrogenase [Rhodothermaceae bacterium RA]|nr:dehydrogenase [Rhodothermaceae bacterium RA]
MKRRGSMPDAVRFRSLLLAALILGGGLAACRPPADPRPQAGPEGRPIEVLFLGHASEHHNSAAFMPLLAGPLAQRGIQITYVQDPADALTPETLAYYDALLLYANHDSITTDQEKALLDFVASGRGFIPVHSASWCFRNSDAFVDLVGGQFASHETGTFTAEIVRPDHPAMAGVEPFETWDETYVHAHHNPDRIVLMERVEGDHQEPYTWVRTHGEGRVFYTALGHDERTWSQPAFHNLLAAGILWAVGDAVRAQWERFEVPTLTYEDARLPNYERRDPPPKMQRPLTPEQSQKLIQVHPEFRLELFAAEPDIVNPVTMAFDERGRLWVVETVDYPNEVRPAGEAGDDRIKILEDTDGDGRADRITVFADSLNIPTSLVFANDGVIVAQAPHFLFLQDTDGDDRADVRRVLMTGWGTFDTHAGPSNLQYGPDNRIWGAVGYAGFEGTIDGQPFRFGQGFYRFRPDGTDFEFLTRTSNNTWGLGFSETFDVFGSTANNAPSWYMAIPDRAFQGVRGLSSPIGSTGIAQFYRMHPITPNVRQVDVFNGYTAAAGHFLYTARAFPRAYWNRAALINEPTGHLLARAWLEADGAGFRAEDGGSLLASADEWVSPVHAQVGPDGAVWVLDWYNFIVQHNPTPEGFETGEGNAYVTDLRDRSHGRIYRIVYREAPPYQPRSLSKDDPEGLLDALDADNMFWRLTAQRLLVERGETDVAEALIERVGARRMDALGLDGGALHALWTLHGLGLLDGSHPDALQAAIQALRHPAAGVRKAAAQALPRTAEARDALLDAGLLRDPDLHTRLAALLVLAEMPASTEAGEQLYAASTDADVYGDRWLAQALYIAAAAHPDGFLAAYRADPRALPPDALPPALRGSSGPAAWQDLPRSQVETWPTMPLPGRWEGQGLPDLDGYVWFIRTVDGTAAGTATLHLGMIDDNETTWVNGVQVGATDGWGESRSYTIPASVWRTGTNVIAVRVHDRSGGGGFHGDPAAMRVVQADGSALPLAGPWHYRVERQTNAPVEYTRPGELAAHVAYHYGGPARPLADTAEAETPDQTITLRAVRQQIAFDQTELTVQAGALVEIVFVNDDLMQHNVVIARPGMLDEVGAAADALAQSPGGAEQQYVPRIPGVIAASDLVDPGQTVRIRFRVPEEPGAYVYVCTFPGHWRTMNGVLNVVPATS